MTHPPSDGSPRFSIVIPCYNRDDFVAATLDSIQAQTWRDFEVIVVDDGSIDRAVEVVRAHPLPKKLVCQPNYGAEAARATGVAATCGEYIVLLDNDDLLFPEALACYDRLITALMKPAVILGAVSLIKGHDGLPPAPAMAGTIEYLPFRDYLSRDVPLSLTCSQLVVKRSVALETGAFRPKPTAFPFDIPDMLLRLGTKGPFVVMRRPFTVAYRQHAGNTVKKIAYMCEASAVLARLERQGSYPGGTARRFDRYACIGTMALFWAHKAFKHRRYLTTCRLLVASAPMILAGLAKRLVRCLRRPTPPGVLAPAA